MGEWVDREWVAGIAGSSHCDRKNRGHIFNAIGQLRGLPGIRGGTRFANSKGMRDWRDALEDRTQSFADAAIEASVTLSTVPGLRKVADQLNDAATSVAANHRAMRRARSDREFAAKLQIVVEEADEAVFWLEIGVKRARKVIDLRPLLTEAQELRAIFMKSRATTRNRQRGHAD